MTERIDVETTRDAVGEEHQPRSCRRCAAGQVQPADPGTNDAGRGDERQLDRAAASDAHVADAASFDRAVVAQDGGHRRPAGAVQAPTHVVENAQHAKLQADAAEGFCGGPGHFGRARTVTQRVDDHEQSDAAVVADERQVSVLRLTRQRAALVKDAHATLAEQKPNMPADDERRNADPVRLVCQAHVDRMACLPSIMRLALDCRLSERLAWDIAISVAELLSNAVRHGSHARMLARVVTEPCRALEIVVHDRGPGIAEPMAALQDGWSRGRMRDPGAAAGSLGIGLGAVARLMDEVEICTAPEGGTIVTVRKWLERAST
jgi:serine/threonine-protein kinase RsbT